MKEVEVLAYVNVIWRPVAEVRLRLVKVVVVRSLQQGISVPNVPPNIASYLSSVEAVD